jgi:hypothetical protein
MGWKGNCPPSAERRPRATFSSKEKVKRSQRFGIHPRLDWWMRIKQPDDSNGYSFSKGEKVGMRAGDKVLQCQCGLAPSCRKIKLNNNRI